MSLALTPSASAETVTYIHTDALGSVVAETDANGNVVKRYDYEPYGAVVGGQVADGPGYTGHVSDAATGLSYMQQRYYDPQLGLFLSVDPISTHSSTKHFQSIQLRLWQSVLLHRSGRKGSGNAIHLRRRPGRPRRHRGPESHESG